MPWEKSYKETDVLERAMLAFWARGYEATSINDLVEVTGINRGSLYAAFDDKHGLFTQALRHYDRVHRQDYLTRLAARHGPKDAILTAFQDAARNIGRGAKPAGCLLVNTALELSPHDPEIRQFVGGSLKAVEDFFCSMIEAGQEDGSVKSTLSARKTAQALMGLFLGLRVLTRSSANRQALDAVTEQARTMLS